MISGGFEVSGNSKFVEIYDTIGKTRNCSLPELPTSRYSTVTKEFLVCGGKKSNDCIRFNIDHGKWEKAHTLNQIRYRYN